MRSIISTVVILGSLAGAGAWAKGGGEAAIEGLVMYPGCAAPADLRVCARPAAGGEPRCVAPTPSAAGLAYRVVVPAGRYHVYAETAERAGYRAYYSAAVRCGLDAACDDHAPEIVEARAGQATTGVAPADWFAPVRDVPTVLARR